jgi:hypothetical protein
MTICFDCGDGDEMLRNISRWTPGSFKPVAKKISLHRPLAFAWKHGVNALLSNWHPCTAHQRRLE